LGAFAALVGTYMTPPDAEARSRALIEHDRDMLMEAGAGTGKTAVIAGRAALLLASGSPPSSIAALTFADAAAAELAARIRSFTAALAEGEVVPELSTALPNGVDAARRACAAQALKEIDRLVATTIHGFCRGVVLAHAVEAGIDPGAVVMDGDEADALFERVLSAWLGRRLSADGDVGDDDPVAALALEDPTHAVDTLRGLARFRRTNRAARPASRTAGPREDAIAFIGAVERFARWQASVPAEQETANLLEKLRALASWYHEHLEAALGFRQLWALSRPPASDLLDREGTRVMPYRVGTASWREAAGASEARSLREEAATHHAACAVAYAELVAGIGSALLATLSGELDELLGDYARAKAEAAALDFDDLLFRADSLLREHPEVRRAVANRHRHILVDEVQDTDVLQVSVLLSVTGLDGSDGSASRRHGALFMVGDPKQAIYRFRGADPASYNTLRAAISAADPDGIVQLTANFRSLPAILKHVDRCLAGPLNAPGQPGHVPLIGTRADPEDGCPRVVRLDIGAGRGRGADHIRDAEASAVAELCANLIGKPMAVGADGGTRDLRPSDIALLSPTHNGLWRWERALAEAGVPVAPLAGKSLLRCQEAYDFLALVRTLADPRDTLAFGALLRGPLVGLTDSELLAATASLPSEDGRTATLSATVSPSAVAHPVLADLLAILRDMRRAAARLTPEAVLVEAVERLRMRAALALRTSDRGARAQANLDALVRRARPFAIRGLKAFAAELQSKWADVQRDPFRDWPEGRCDDAEDAVTLCTVHAAKGLEWPVVVVVNSVAGLRPPYAFLHRRSDGTLHGSLPRLASRGHADARAEEVRAEKLERVRLWYVACTRARDLLVLPQLPRLPDGAWAGLVDLRVGELPTLHLEADPPVCEVAMTNRQSLPLFALEAARVAASAPIVSWRTPSADDPDRRRDVPSSIPDPDGVVPAEATGAGRARGAVIHKLIEEVLTGELPHTGAVVRERAASLLTQLGAGLNRAGPDPAECAGTALSALALPDVAEFRQKLVPEWPIHAMAPDGALVSGRVDAVVLGGAGDVEVVIDWKSDVNPDPAARRAHAAQMTDYLEATGATRGAIVYVSQSEVSWIERSGA
jgi:CRISPR-associated exonuclease Cas4